jgi:hypothetical protein
MKRFLFLSLFFLSFPLFAQVSFQNETRSFNEMGLTTNEQIAKYLQIDLTDLLPIFEHNSIKGLGASISPADFYNVISGAFRTEDMLILLRLCRELGVTFENLIFAISEETGQVSDEDIQIVLATYRIGVKWGIVSP